MEAPQAIRIVDAKTGTTSDGSILVGHLVFMPSTERRKPHRVTASPDWRGDLLSLKDAVDIVREGMTPQWANDIGRVMASDGAALLHVYLTPGREMPLDFVDCHPACPQALTGRAFLKPDLGSVH